MLSKKKGSISPFFKLFFKFLPERQGFEPWVPLQVQRISNPSRSTTPAPLHA